MFFFFQRRKMCDKYETCVESFFAEISTRTEITYRQALNAYLKWAIDNESDPWRTDIVQARKFLLQLSEKSPDRGTAKTISTTTVRKYGQILHAIWGRLSSEYKEILNPWREASRPYRRAKGGTRRPTILTPYEKILALINAPEKDTPIGLRDRCVLAMLYAGGLRRGEACKLQVRDITLEPLSIRLLETKNGRSYDHSLPQWAKPYIEDYLRVRLELDKASIEDPLFVSYYGPNNVCANRAMDDSTLYKLYKRWASRVGLPKEVAPHSARASAITRLLDDGFSHRDVAIFSRHASVATVEVYDKRRRDQELNPAKRLSYGEEKKSVD